MIVPVDWLNDYLIAQRADFGRSRDGVESLVTDSCSRSVMLLTNL